MFLPLLLLFFFLKVSPPSASNYSCRKNQKNKMVLLGVEKQELLFRKHINAFGVLLSYDFAR